MDRVIKLIKNRSDIGGGTRGSDLGVDALEVAAINHGSEYFNQFTFEDVKTHNETIYDKNRNTFAKRIEFVLEQCTRVSYTIKRTLEAHFLPIVLSGDHSSALGTISGIKAVYPDKTLGVIWIDAHADLHSPYTSPSGNIHGMPLAAALGFDNLKCQINEVIPETQQHWEEIKNIGVEGPKLEHEHLIYFGVRDTEEAEDIQIAELGIKNFRVEEVRFKGLENCVERALAQLIHCDMIYVSFDVDSLDCDLISNGTGTPVSKGFDQYEVIAIINQIIASGKVVCVEICEINPLLDTKGNKMAEAAFEVLEQITSALILPFE
ncbi:arginase [Flavobacterium glycines]|uniref:Arginase n=1 Tax=Flavobacterium glycines TaxID=551990 RepID=A0A1B9DT81_9FLAO|nr:arginase [Flavobacterium glycines]OCB72908.1 arginase [Flavobacterium glycines]GEL12161.1 arginase [Flavobacterium glycines]SDJ96288.1 arginase [Flavobacterium glycines]